MWLINDLIRHMTLVALQKVMNDIEKISSKYQQSFITNNKDKIFMHLRYTKSIIIILYMRIIKTIFYNSTRIGKILKLNVNI